MIIILSGGVGMNTFIGLGVFGFIFLIIYFIGCLALGGWLASEKGYSVGSWVILLLLFGVLALIVLVGAPDKKSQTIIKEMQIIGNKNDDKKWNCPQCKNENPNNSFQCLSCGYKIK